MQNDYKKQIVVHNTKSFFSRQNLVIEFSHSGDPFYHYIPRLPGSSISKVFKILLSTSLG